MNDGRLLIKNGLIRPKMTSRSSRRALKSAGDGSPGGQTASPPGPTDLTQGLGRRALWAEAVGGGPRRPESGSPRVSRLRARALPARRRDRLGPGPGAGKGVRAPLPAVSGLKEEGGRTIAPSGYQEHQPGNGGALAGAEKMDRKRAGWSPPLPPPFLTPRRSPPCHRPPGRPRLRRQARSQASQSQTRSLRSSPVLGPPLPASPSLVGARRARPLPLGSGRAGGFGLRGGGGGGEAGELVSGGAGASVCESPVPGARATQSERLAARAGAEPEPESRPPPRARPRRAPTAPPPPPRAASRLALSPAPPLEPGAHRLPAGLEAARGARGMSQRLLGAPSRRRAAAAPGSRDHEPSVRPLRKSGVSHGESQLPG